MLNTPLSQSQIEEKVRNENLGEWLQLWWVSQGDEARNRRLRLIAEMVPFKRDQEFAVLDMCCGSW